LRTITNLTPENYLKVLARCACAVGNSSSFVRDAGLLGTPVVLVGARQDAREHDVHVTRVEPKRELIAKAISAQLAHKHYPPSTLYGDGQVSERIASSLAQIELYVQKKLAYTLKPNG
jgi:UDP-N-acetylglucosamine 2-epimerase